MLKGLEKIVKLWSNWFNWIAILALILMICVIATDIIGAKLFSWPLPGAVEVVSFRLIQIASKVRKQLHLKSSMIWEMLRIIYSFL